MIDIPFTEIGRGIVASTPILAAAAGYFRGPSARRRKIARNVELYGSLPSGSRAQDVVGDWLNHQVDSLRNFETDATRNRQDMGVSAFLTAAFAALALWLVSLGHWWWYVASILPWLFVMVGIGNTFEAAQLAKRDDNGKRIPD